MGCSWPNLGQFEHQCPSINHEFNFYFYLFILFIYFLSALGLLCCTRTFSSCGKRGLVFLVVHGLLIVVASLVAEHGLQACRLQQLQHTGSVAVVHGPQSAQASVVVARGLSICITRALGHTGFSSCGVQAQQLWLTGSRAQAQQLWCMGLVALRQVGSSRAKDHTCVPCIGRQILNHCATREVPQSRILNQ